MKITKEGKRFWCPRLRSILQDEADFGAQSLQNKIILTGSDDDKRLLYIFRNLFYRGSFPRSYKDTMKILEKTEGYFQKRLEKNKENLNLIREMQRLLKFYEKR